MQLNLGNRKRNIRRRAIYILIDILIVTASFLIFVWIKPASKRIYLPIYFNPFLFFSAVWLFISFVISKYDLYKARKPKDALAPVLISNLTILAVITTLIYSFGIFHYSRLIVFGTILLATILEIIFAYLYFSYKRPVIVPEFDATRVRKPRYYPADKTFVSKKADETKYMESREQIKNIIVEETNSEVYDFISKYIDVGNPQNLVLSTTTQFNIDQLPVERFKSLVNLHKFF